MEEYSSPHFTAVNYILMVLGSGLILAIVTALIVIFVLHRRKDRIQRRHKLLHRRRKATEYYRPHGITQIHVNAALDIT